ncbi:MAG: cyclodeaminase/cyclohydrolase family protein [Candidatus Omnitrophota bacterium]
MQEREYLNSTVDAYLKELSARSETPGGGSASALSAALGASLNLMVINYSGKAVKENSEGLEASKNRQQESLDKLSELIDEDSRVFRQLTEKLSARQNAQKEYIAAAIVPMNICREAHVSMDITSYLSEKGNKNLVSDVGCAAHLLKGAFYSAQLNVQINLKYITDISFCENAETALATMRKDIENIWMKVSHQVNDVMNPEGI